MKAILRSINNFSCKLKQSNNLKYNISPKIRSNKFKNISGNGNVTIEDALNKNLKDYKIYGNTKQQILPDGYTQVDYIESSGTQYIDTGVNADNNLRVVLDMQYTDLSIDNNTNFGAIRSGSPNIRYHMLCQNVLFRFYTQDGGLNLSNKDTSRHLFDFDVPNNLIIVDDTKFTKTINSFDTQLNFWLFGRNSNSTDLKFYNSSKLYSCQMHYNNELVRDFIPCYRNSDNEVGLYDIANDVFYTNNGTGSFTYGSVAPTPDAPIEMVSCGDRTKNLCGELEQGGYNVNTGEKIANTSLYRNKEPIKVSPNTNYIFSVNGEGKAINVLEYKLDGTFIGRIGSTALPANSFFTPSNETAYINIFRSSNTGTEKWQIEQNDTVTSYEPYYDGYKIPVNVRSDNLFDKDNYEYIAAYLASSNKITSGVEGATCFYVKCKSNTTYNVSKTSLLGNDRFCLFDTSSLPTIGDTALSYVGTRTGNDNNKDLTITTNPTAEYLCIFVKASTTAPNASVQDIANTLQIVEGSVTPSKYIPYYNETTNIYLDEPLRKIEDYSDYIDFKNGKVVRNISEIVLNGSESWAKSSRADVNRYFVGVTSNPLIHTIKNMYTIDLISDYFKCIAPAISDNGGIGLAKYNATGFLLNFELSNTNFDTLSKFLNWLSTHNTTVYYVLATPTEEDIELPNINLIEGKNIITIGTDLQGVFETEYYSKEIIDISNYKYNLRKVED